VHDYEFGGEVDIIGLLRPVGLNQERAAPETPELHCVSKTHQLWNGTVRNYKDQFWWHLADIFTRLYTGHRK